MAETIDYTMVLADLEAKRAAIDSAIGAVRQLLNLGAEQGVAASSGSFPPNKKESTEVEFDSFFGMSVTEAIRKYLNMMKRPQVLSDIAQALQKGGLPTTSTNLSSVVAPTLSRMRTAGDTMQVQGKWALTEWYPAGARERVEALERDKAKKGKRRAKKKIALSTPAAQKQETPQSKAAEQPKKPTEHQVAEIVALHEAGKKAGEIAKETGVHIFNVTRIIKSHGKAAEPAASQG